MGIVVRVTIKCLLLALCIGFGAIGPAYAEDLEYIGNSRIEMSDWLKKQWDKYQNAFNKGTFVIKFDEGKVWVNHWACHKGHTSSDCYSENRSQMMYKIRQYDKKWQIFAEEGKIVWKGPVCYQGQNLSKFGDCNSYNSSNQNASSSSYSRPMSDEDVCKGATRLDGAWETEQYLKHYVDKAKDRNLTVERCSELTGRPNPKVTTSQATSSNSPLKEMADKTLCFGATKADGNWEQEYAYKKFVNEAKSRSLSLERCSELTGRIVSTSKPDDKEMICRNALSEDGTNWETGKIFSEYVYEAKRRGYTTEDCAKINSNKATPTAPPNTSKKELIDNIEVRLKKLKKLEDAGLITSEEAAEKRKEILRDM